MTNNPNKPPPSMTTVNVTDINMKNQLSEATEYKTTHQLVHSGSTSQVKKIICQSYK